MWAFLNSNSGGIQAITTIVLVIITACYVYLTYKMVKTMREELDDHRKQARGSLLFNLQEVFFFKGKNREIMQAIEKRVAATKSGIYKYSLLAAGTGIEEYELNDYLGYFELIGNFEELGILEFELIDSVFGYSLARTYENQDVKKYIKKLREDFQDKRYFSGFERLALKILEEEQKRKS